MRKFCCVAALFSIVMAHPADAAGVDAYSYSVSKQSGCGTSGPSPNIRATGLALITIPYQDAPCSAGQVLRIRAAVIKPVMAGSAAVGSGRSAWGSWSETGASAGNAWYGALNARAHGAFTGFGDGNTLDGHEAFGRFDDQLTFTGGAGGGVAHLTFTVTGFGTAKTTGYGEMSLNFMNSNAGLDRELMRLVVSNDGWTLRNDGQYILSGGKKINPLPSGASVIASGVLLKNMATHFDLPFTFGTPVDLTMLLFASAFGASGPATNTVAFQSAVMLSRISVDGVPTAAVTAASGTVYPIGP